MTVLVCVLAGVRARVTPVPQAPAENPEAHRDHEQGRGEVEPRVELLRDDELRERERDEPEREDADRVRHGHDQPEQSRVTGGPARADEVRRDDRLPVPRAEGVRSAPEHRQQEREHDDPGAQVVADDQAREAAVRRRDGHAGAQVGRGEKRGRGPGTTARYERGASLRHVERTLEQVLRVGTQLVAPADRRRRRRDDARAGVGGEHHLPPADPAGVVRVAKRQRERRRGGERRCLVERLEAERREPALARRERERVVERGQREPAAADREHESPPDPRGRLALVGGQAPDLLPLLERRDLGHVEHVVDVDPVTRELDAAEAVHGEVAEWVSARCTGRAKGAGECE